MNSFMPNKKRKLNIWMRTWVVLSVVWVIVAAWPVYTVVRDQFDYFHDPRLSIQSTNQDTETNENPSVAISDYSSLRVGEVIIGDQDDGQYVFMGGKDFIPLDEYDEYVKKEDIKNDRIWLLYGLLVLILPPIAVLLLGHAIAWILRAKEESHE